MCMAVTIIDEDISSYVREAEMTMDIRDQACTSIPYKTGVFFISHTHDKAKCTMKKKPVRSKQ